jgi:putative nucleotidyltransferase with HDIG domain
MDQEEEKYARIEKIVQMVNESEISSVQNVVSGITKIINDPESSAKDLKEIIQIDPPLTGKLLKLANSVHYSPRTKVSEIQQAIIWVGYDALKELALSQKVCEVFAGDSDIEGYSRNLLWKHSVAVALLGKMIYRREFGRKGENIYVAGLMHDIGIIALDQFCQDDFRLILNKTKTDKKNHSKTEKEVLGFDHAEVGKGITDSWNLPQELIEVIGCHHNPDNISRDFVRPGLTLYVADYVCQQKRLGYGDAPVQDKELFKKCLKRLELSSYALDLIAEDVEQELRKMEEQGLF